MVVAPLLIAIPLAAAFLIPLVSQVSRRLPRYIPPLALAANFILSCVLVPQTLRESIVVSIGGWEPPFCINLVVGPLGILLTMLISLVSFFIALYALAYIDKEPSDKYHVLFLLLVTGATGTVLTGDIFNLFVFFEILCISSYALTAYNRDREGTEAGFKYLVQGTVGSTLILIAIAFLYGFTGTLNMADIAQRISSANSFDLFVIFALFMVGFGVEAAVFPLNAWLPDAHSSAPSTISAILSGIAIKAGLYAIARTAYTLFNASGLSVFLSVLGVVTLVVGEVSAYRQREDVKRMLAYSSIGQVGLILFALGIATSAGVFGALFQLVNHALAKALLFLAVGYMIRKAGSKQLSSLGGLGREMPVTCLMFAIAAFSLIGLPPFAGFMSKLSIIYAALATKQGILLAFVVVVLVATVVEAGYFFRLVQTMYFKEAGNLARRGDAPPFGLVPLVALGTLIVLIGVFPQIVAPVLRGGAEELLHRADYVRIVLGKP
jgi:proton-translocating NADH-quinone oxidoreductase chain N